MGQKKYRYILTKKYEQKRKGGLFFCFLTQQKISNFLTHIFSYFFNTKCFCKQQQKILKFLFLKLFCVKIFVLNVRIVEKDFR